MNRDIGLELIKEKNQVFFDTLDNIIAKTIGGYMQK